MPCSVDHVALRPALSRLAEVVEQCNLTRGEDANAVLMHECWGARALEREFVAQAAHSPDHRPGAHVDLGYLTQAAERHDEIAVAVHVERVPVRPVDVHTSTILGGQVGDGK